MQGIPLNVLFFILKCVAMKHFLFYYEWFLMSIIIRNQENITGNHEKSTWEHSSLMENGTKIYFLRASS